MELTGSWKRWVVLAIIVGAFVVLKGFDPRAYGVGNIRGWTYASLAFLGGAVCATVVDHWVGNLDRSNLRWAYVCFGVLVMAVGGLAFHVLRGSVPG